MYNKLFEKWVENFLIDKLLEVLCVKGNEMNYCDLCKCMNEKVMYGIVVLCVCKSLW